MEGLLSAHLIIAITCFFGKKTSKTHLVNPKKILWYYRFFSFQQRDTNFSNYNVLYSRWVSVVDFHDQALSIGKFFGQESTVVKWNYQILNLHLVTVCQKVPILDFQSEFSMSKIIRIFLKKNFIEEYQFRRTFFVKSIFGWLQF